MGYNTKEIGKKISGDDKMRIYYRKNNTGIEVVRVWGHSDIVRIPEKIGDETVTGIAPYTFSNHKDEEENDLMTVELDGGVGMEPELRAGLTVKEVHLPGTVTYIGNYAFYGCMDMTTFHGSDRIVRMGSGVFTGCRLSRVQIDFYDGDKSCLKEILTEIRYEIVASLYYKNNDSTEVKIVFPEHYLDAVENTPARIVENRYYGSGGEYRECFYRKTLDYLKYDQMFSISRVRDEGKATAGVALLRLKYPYMLTKEAGETYENYLKENMDHFVDYLLETEGQGNRFYGVEVVDILEFCCKKQYFDRDSLQKAIEKAADGGQTEILSILMDARHRYFPEKRKKFVL